jgi:tetratricopeptide (TPR) repeat protein
LRPHPLFEQAFTVQRAGDTAQAIQIYHRLLEQAPSADIYANLGVALRTQGKLLAAITLYRRALALEPQHLSALSNLGGALWANGAPQEAVSILQRALALNPQMASLHYNLGLAYQDLQQPQAALACFEAVLRLEPQRTDAPVDRARALLQMGDLRAGFEAYESRFAYEPRLVKPFGQPRWDGSPLNGRTLLLYAEQGYGDTLQFCRYIPLIPQSCGRIILECPPPLKRLMQTVPGVSAVISEGDAYPSFDIYASLFSLPHLFQTTLASIPTEIPYLQAPDSRVHLLEQPQTLLKVGIVWASGHADVGLKNRSIGLEPFLRILELHQVCLYSLQKGPASAQLAQLGVEGLIPNVGGQVEDFADTASVLSQLDLLISADTAIVHLAGALGIPTWVLLPAASEWRWLLHREDSPWYPTLQLFRQHVPGDWHGTFDPVLSALYDVSTRKTKRNGRCP